MIAGDYGDEGLFIPEDRPLNDQEKQHVENAYSELGRVGKDTTKDLRLDDWASIYFKDMSKDVIQGMKLDPYLARCLSKKK